MYNKFSFLLFCLLISYSISAQRIINGYVYDETKEPLIGANVSVKDTDLGITTDYEGFFELSIPEGEVTLVASYTGYKNQEFLLKSDQESVEFILASSAILNEVVVSGSRREKRKYKEEELKEAVYGYTITKDEDLAVGTTAGVRIKEDVKGKSKRKPTSSTPVSPSVEPVLEEVPHDVRSEAIDAYSDVMLEMDKVSEEPVYMDELLSTATFGTTTTEADLPKAGQLTAGIINDFGKWNLWQDIQLNELESWQEAWQIRPWDRYPIQLTTQNGYPIVNAIVYLLDGEKKIWTSVTDNTGKAELWANLYEDKESKEYKFLIEYENQSYEMNAVKSFHEGGNSKKLPVQCDIPNIVDIAFVVDATGSMGDEINYLKSELTDVINRAKDQLKDVELRLGSVFYRDLGDAYVTRKSHFSTDISKTVRFIEKQSAAGGGDGPEAVEEAFDQAIDNMTWSENASARLMFLVLDAPPHQTNEIKERLRKHIEKAAEKGIRIIPVACSGTDRSTEYLMRSFALSTNGSYIYLTDDSGIGGSHQKPITDEHKVNLLNDLLVQTITDFSSTVSCDEQLDFVDDTLTDTMEVALYVQNKEDPNGNPEDMIQQTEFSWKYYPNPCNGTLWVEINGELDFLYLFDGAGKLLKRITINDQSLELDLSNYPTGMYYLRGIGKDDREVSGKVILSRTY